MGFFSENKRVFNILLLTCLVGFLVLPNISLADEFDDITLRETAKYLELPGGEVQDLIRSFINIFHSEWENLVGSGYVTAEKMAVPSIMKKAVQVQALNHLLIDAPIETTWAIIKNATKIAKIFLIQDFSGILEELEKESVKRAVGYGMNVLLQNEIRVSPGAIEFEYELREGGIGKALIQYIMIYKPFDAKTGEMIVKFYSTESLKPPKNKGSIGAAVVMYTELEHDLPPFIVDIRGTVENYQWVGNPSMKIDFPPTVPDLGIKPLSLWEKYLLKPIETTIKEVEIIITKATGKSLGLTDIWEEVKKFISKIKSFAPAGLVETPLPEEEETPVEVEQEVGQVPSVEVKPQQTPPKPELSPEERLAEIQETLDDIAERVDVLSQKVTKLTGVEVKPQQSQLEEVKEKKEEEIEKEEEEKEIEEEKTESEVGQEGVGQKLCEKISGSYLLRNRIIINEVAWMGSTNSANDEWIELKNISGAEIDLAGWQIVNKEKKIKIIFDRGRASVNGFLLLERTNDDSVPGIAADLIYTGALSNTNEALYLFDENCQLQDEVLANPDWPAGDNSSKRTMERKPDLTWQTSLNPGGTPKRENSEGYVEYYGGGGGGTPAPPPPAPQFFPIIINEIMYDLEGSDDGREWIEIFNTGTSEVDLTNWSFYEKETNHKLTLIRGTATLSANGYAIIADNAEKFLEDHPNYSGTLFDSAFSLSNTREKIAIKNGDLIIDEVTYESSWGANGDGNSLQKFDNQWLAAPPTPGRKNELPPPVLEVSTTNLNFEAIEDVKAPEDQSLIIQNSGGSNLNWQISSSENWLKFESSGGLVSPHSSSTVTVSIVDINEFATGTYSATFNIEAAGAQNSPKQISVNLIIYEKQFAQNVVISEVQIASTSSTDDEFIELYNPKETPVDLSQWSIQKSYSTSTIVYKKNFEAGNQIPSKGYFLIVYASSTDQNLLNLANLTHKTFSLSQNNTIYLVANREEIEGAADPDIVDKVGFGENVFAEGNPAPNPPAGKSLGRKIAIDDEGNLNYLDLDNNRLDFEIQEPTPGKQNENLKPTAKFDFSQKSPYVGDNILFDASGSRDPDGKIVSYVWDFGDGSSTSTTSSEITKFFSASGTFPVSLSVIDDLGATSTSTTTEISISSREPLSIIINEISWMGTKASSSDEWIEFYNNTTSTIDIINWSISGAETGDCLNFSDAGSTTTIVLHGGYLIYAARREAVKDENEQIIVDIWDDEIEMDDNLPSQLILYDAPNCQGDLIDVVGSMNGEWFAGNTTDSISMERISATTTGATSTNWASNNLITRNGLDAEGNKINGTPKAANSVSISPTAISSLPFDEFPEITLTYLGNPYIINTLTVPENKILKIESGVALKFKELQYYGGGDSLIIQGTLLAEGELGKEIIFTSFLLPEGDKNWWSRIYFAPSSQNSIFDYCQIRYGGKKQDESYQIIVDSTSINFKNSILEKPNISAIKLINSSSTIENLTIQNASAGKAIEIVGGSPTIKKSFFRNTVSGIFIKEGSRALVEGNSFENINYLLGPVVVNNSYPIFKNNTAQNNFYWNGIYLSGTINQNWTLNKDLPYLIENLRVSENIILTVEPGVIIKFLPQKFSPQGKLEIYGTLNATSSSKDIIFTSIFDDEFGGDTNNDATLTTPFSSGFWDQIYFATSSQDSILENVILSYGGKGVKGAIHIEEAKVELRNNLLKNNGPGGYPTLYIKNSASSTIENSTFENCGVAIKIIGECPQITEDLTFINCNYTYSRTYDSTTTNSTSTNSSTVCP